VQAGPKGLVDRFEEREVLGAGRDPAPWLRVVVDDFLQLGRQIERTLDLVDHRSLRK
jgi:hypothetical protein